ncbi:putative ubiquitin-conjugating enzyme E2-binding protein [Helianthus annuus]|nr:putative ubiquitin-conjugating enzyme E2-binding protein [Helianthus annuus]
MTTSEHLLPATKNPNPRNWKFTWESNSHVPILKLYLINPNTNPISQCIDLKVSILFHKSLLQLTWIDNNQSQSLWVPIPRVLIDADSPISFRALDDHIEVKLVLVLPVDHPIVSNFDFEGGLDAALDDDCQPLQLDSDLKKLASCGEVHFFCRGCSTKLSSAVRNFKEMPSVNWREAADNWFGTCCCSFGGASEKLVAQYANSYSCTPGVCLVDPTSIVLCKDDFVGYEFPNRIEHREHKSSEIYRTENLKKAVSDNKSTNGSVVDHNSQNECCHLHTDEDQTHSTSELLTNKASLLNGLLGNCFMVASPYLSKDIKWSEILCPHCSCLLGAYPHDNTDGLLNDYGVHLFKCFISTCPVGGPTDLFWKYTLERMFTSQLLESAKDELSFRTVVKNLQTRSPMLQIVLLNPNAWCSFGDCLDAMIPVPNFIMYPMVKVLFSNCSNSTESELRKLDEWVTKHQVGDVYMLTSKDLAESLEIANRMLPSSHAFLQGLSLSFLRR